MRLSSVLIVALLSLAFAGCAENSQDAAQPRSVNPQIPRNQMGPGDVGGPSREPMGGKGRENTLPKGKQP